MENLLILHGWGSCAKNWANVKGLLETQGYKVFVPDLPGFGEATPPATAWHIDDYVEWVRDFCEKQNLSQVFLLGHSFGGSIAVKYALKYPENIKKLFLVAPAIIRKKTFKKEIFKKLSIFFPKSPFLRKVFYRIFSLKSDYPYAKGIMKEIMKNTISEDLKPYLPKITAKTLVIWGKEDKTTPSADAYLIKEKIPNSVLEILSNIAHNPHREAPEVLTQKIIEFIK